MNVATRVRPAFLKVSIFVFAMLLPFAMYAAWDYVEVSRLNRRVIQVASRGEAVAVVRLPRSTAWQFYRAAMAIAHHNMALPQNTEALRLLDQAVALPFEGFPPGFSYDYFGGDIFTLARVAGARTQRLAASGDRAAASESLRAELRLQHPMSSDGVSMWFSQSASDLNLALNRFPFDPASLARLEEALAVLDDDNHLTGSFVAARARLLETRVPPMRFPGMGPPPWQLHQTNERIDIFTEMIAAAERPWPSRLDTLGVPATWKPKRLRMSDSARVQQKTFGELVAHTEAWRLALLRSARGVVAVERYRRDHDEHLPPRIEELYPAYMPAVLVDPFSGGPLKLDVRDRAYVVYSIGVNRRDDGGNVPAAIPHNDDKVDSVPDLGILVQTDSQR